MPDARQRRSEGDLSEADQLVLEVNTGKPASTAAPASPLGGAPPGGGQRGGGRMF